MYGHVVWFFFILLDDIKRPDGVNNGTRKPIKIIRDDNKCHKIWSLSGPVKELCPDGCQTRMVTLYILRTADMATVSMFVINTDANNVYSAQT